MDRIKAVRVALHDAWSFGRPKCAILLVFVNCIGFFNRFFVYSCKRGVPYLSDLDSGMRGHLIHNVRMGEHANESS